MPYAAGPPLHKVRVAQLRQAAPATANGRLACAALITPALPVLAVVSLLPSSSRLLTLLPIQHLEEKTRAAAKVRIEQPFEDSII